MSEPSTPQPRRRSNLTLLPIAVTTILAMVAPPSHAQSGHLTSQPPTARADGPTIVHDPAFTGAHVKIRSIDVPLTSLTLAILEVDGLPNAAHGRVLGAHIHTRGCANDPAASGPHHANPSADETKPLAAREVWLDLRIDNRGSGIALALFDWRIRAGDAGSVVIHAEPTNPVTGAAGARVLCTTIPLGT